MSEMFWEELLRQAALAREKAYAPYSQFRVGAAAYFEDETLVVGCNVENCSYGITICAERVAISRGVADGKRRLKALALVADSSEPCSPCGMCRQVMSEFAGPELLIRSRNLQGVEREYTLGTLLPEAFSSEALPKK